MSIPIRIVKSGFIVAPKFKDLAFKNSSCIVCTGRRCGICKTTYAVLGHNGWRHFKDSQEAIKYRKEEEERAQCEKND